MRTFQIPIAILISALVLSLGSGCDGTVDPDLQAEASLDMPILVAPFRDDAFPAGEEIVFSWTDVADAVGYEVEIADANGTPVVSRKTKLAGCVCALDAAGVYTWRVRALDVRQRPGPWSRSRSFTLTAPAN